MADENKDINEEQLTNFFTAFCYRKYNENTLSDITYALCSALPEFKNFFLKFCFGEKIKDTFVENCIIKREDSKKDSRPDFLIYEDKKVDSSYLIESKLKDKDYHIDQYNRDFKDTEKSLITFEVPNYADKKCAEESKWKIVSWVVFYYKLKDWNKDQNCILIKGYLEYFKQLYNQKFKKNGYITEIIKKVKLTDNTKIPIFMALLELVCQELHYKSDYIFTKFKYGLKIYYEDKKYFSIYTDFKSNICVYLNGNTRYLKQTELQKFEGENEAEQKEYIIDLVQVLKNNKSNEISHQFTDNKCYVDSNIDFIKIFDKSNIPQNCYIERGKFDSNKDYYGYYYTYNGHEKAFWLGYFFETKKYYFWIERTCTEDTKTKTLIEEQLIKCDNNLDKKNNLKISYVWYSNTYEFWYEYIGEESIENKPDMFNEFIEFAGLKE